MINFAAVDFVLLSFYRSDTFLLTLGACCNVTGRGVIITSLFMTCLFELVLCGVLEEGKTANQGENLCLLPLLAL